jgi:hypothetical protein
MLGFALVITFGFLIKKVSIKTSTRTSTSSTNDNWQSFNNDNWQFDDVKKQDRDDRNSIKAREQAAKRQSKPLKLGAKKLND